MSLHHIYFGGSRHHNNINRMLYPVVIAAIEKATFLHVGCQFGADQAVIQTACAKHAAFALHIFVVSGQEIAPTWVTSAGKLGANVTYQAGGPATIPTPARFLRRSIAAFQGCKQAVFFNPGPGSLAVAREAIKAGLQVFAFSESQPEPIPSQAGQWSTSQFFGFTCWQWQPAQTTLF